MLHPEALELRERHQNQQTRMQFHSAPIWVHAPEADRAVIQFKRYTMVQKASSNSQAKFKLENLVPLPSKMPGITIRFPGSGLSSYTRSDFTPERQTPPQGRSAPAGAGDAWGEELSRTPVAAKPSLAFLHRLPLPPFTRPRARPDTRYLQHLRRSSSSSRPRSRRPLVRCAAATSRPPAS